MSENIENMLIRIIASGNECYLNFGQPNEAGVKIFTIHPGQVGRSQYYKLTTSECRQNQTLKN
jgi:NADH:ubiquinone oxidoreductase subunit F (NADH-binding)